ncbi:unnamed protein product [Adineta steineri]|uniref:Uncharacterized protein n=1 Tax=Adineta steineri TaxID=433720 RepID=A0A819FEL9_9BILA|nr:unnamed protein product [Adineta steineri]CAF3866384.1 unnamed protein product [Adineta steineri]
MSTEQKDEKFTLHFLDCDCTCCGVRQRYIPSLACNIDHSQFQQLVKDLSKPRYGLDCNCLCGTKSPSTTTKDSCACPISNTTTTTPIQVNFSVDTGVKQLSNVPVSLQK